MDRFFVAEGSWGHSKAVLSIEESHHCVRVMRKSAGDKIEVFDGAGRWARGVIAEGSDREVTVLVEEEGKEQEKKPSLLMAIAVTKGKTMELVIQKAVELGVDRIQPLLTENVAVHWSGEILKGRQENGGGWPWRRASSAGRILFPKCALL